MCEKLVYESLGRVAGSGVEESFWRVGRKRVSVVAEKISKVEGVGDRFGHCDGTRVLLLVVGALGKKKINTYGRSCLSC